MQAGRRRAEVPLTGAQATGAPVHPAISSLVYRDIFPVDVRAVDELQQQLFPVRYSEGFYERLFTPGHYTVLATTPAGHIIGIASGRTVVDEMVGSQSEEGKEGYIMTLGVHESYRRLGLASELLRRIMAILRSVGCTIAALHVKSLNVVACRFYERNHFYPDPAGGWYPGHYYIDGVQYDAYRLIAPLTTGLVGWLANKLGITTDPLQGLPGWSGLQDPAVQERQRAMASMPADASSHALAPRQAQLSGNECRDAGRDVVGRTAAGLRTGGGTRCAW
jgi:ribosomal protein S18 acetylase RimI-like enzyme